MINQTIITDKMGRNLRQSMALPAFINYKEAVKYLVLSFILLITAQTYAQHLKLEAPQQKRLLLLENASLTQTQKKIDSRILYPIKLQGQPEFGRKLLSFRTGIKPNEQGKIKIDIKATITPQLLNDIKALGADIIFSSEISKSIVANVPLNNVE